MPTSTPVDRAAINAVRNRLEVFHQGEPNAATKRQLSHVLGFDERGRQVEAAVEALRGEGVPVCSGSKGYWWPATDDEIETTIARELGRRRRHGRTLSGLIRGLRERRKHGNQPTAPAERGMLF